MNGPGKDSSFPVVDLSDYGGADKEASLAAAHNLAAVCHRYGFTAVKGHGLSDETLENGFEHARKLFALPYEQKMKAPHPPTAKPHRGYSGIGREKVYSKDDLKAGDGGNGVDAVRKIMDYKESYEIGSEVNPEQTNIWLPEDVFPGFRSSMVKFYYQLEQTAQRILEAFADGLNLSGKDREALMRLNSKEQNQLRLLHYPEISPEILEKEVLARLPAHTDFSCFTILFQDKQGGLEFRDPQTGNFLLGDSVGSTLMLNIGDMFQRFTNDYFKSATHRVSVPEIASSGGKSVPARYSIPYFMSPPADLLVETCDAFVSETSPAKYEPILFKDYGAWITKYQYAQKESESREKNIG